ncbi:unnamed protein product [Cylindrotheca closterium]|nr:unnamed protein product [Cylindrotheca closterium]
MKASHHACYNGHLEIVKLLILEKGADVHAKDEDGETLLHKACEMGHLEVVKFLLEQGADVHAKNKYGSTPLYLPCHNGHLEVVKLLAIDKGAEVRVKDKYDKTPLHHASYNGHLEVAKVLFEKGADVQAKDDDGWTPLQRACTKGQLEIVKCLLEKDADVKAKDNRGHTPLHEACEKGYIKLVKVLLEKGADADAKTIDGETPSDVVQSDDVRGPRIQAILSGQLEINSTDDAISIFPDAVLSDVDEASFPLHCAVKYGDLDVIKDVLQDISNEDEKNTIDSNGRTAIDLAALTGQMQVLKLLADNGCKHERPKPKMIAICKKRSDLSKKYLEQVNDSL